MELHFHLTVDVFPHGGYNVLLTHPTPDQDLEVSPNPVIRSSGKTVTFSYLACYKQKQVGFEKNLSIYRDGQTITRSTFIRLLGIAHADLNNLEALCLQKLR